MIYIKTSPEALTENNDLKPIHQLSYFMKTKP